MKDLGLLVTLEMSYFVRDTFATLEFSRHSISALSALAAIRPDLWELALRDEHVCRRARGRSGPRLRRLILVDTSGDSTRASPRLVTACTRHRG